LGDDALHGWAKKGRFGETPKSELATASLRPDWRYTGDARATRGIDAEISQIMRVI